MLASPRRHRHPTQTRTRACRPGSSTSPRAGLGEAEEGSGLSGTLRGRVPSLGLPSQATSPCCSGCGFWHATRSPACLLRAEAPIGLRHSTPYRDESEDAGFLPGSGPGTGSARVRVVPQRSLRVGGAGSPPGATWEGPGSPPGVTWEGAGSLPGAPWEGAGSPPPAWGRAQATPCRAPSAASPAPPSKQSAPLMLVPRPLRVSSPSPVAWRLRHRGHRQSRALRRLTPCRYTGGRRHHRAPRGDCVLEGHQVGGPLLASGARGAPTGGFSGGVGSITMRWDGSVCQWRRGRARPPKEGGGGPPLAESQTNALRPRVTRRPGPTLRVAVETPAAASPPRQAHTSGHRGQRAPLAQDPHAGDCASVPRGR